MLITMMIKMKALNIYVDCNTYHRKDLGSTAYSGRASTFFSLLVLTMQNFLYVDDFRTEIGVGVVPGPIFMGNFLVNVDKSMFTSRPLKRQYICISF